MFEDEIIPKITETEMKNLSLNVYSCLKENGKKINYMTYIKQRKNDECNQAFSRVFPKIKINEIKNFIHNIEEMSPIRRNFYEELIKRRYELLNKWCQK